MDAILAKANAGPIVTNFIKVVARNGRLFALPAIIAAFRALAAKARGEVSADVTSAAPLTPRAGRQSRRDAEGQDRQDRHPHGTCRSQS